MAEPTFLDRLASIRAQTCADMPTPQLAVLTRTITRLRREGIHDKCLQVGETAPDFEFIDANDEVCSLYEVLKAGPALLNFYRGLWCEFCATEVQAYENIQADLQAMGCAYFAISPQPVDSSGGDPASYQAICDRDNRIARQYGIVYSLEQDEIDLFSSWGLRLDEVHGSTRWELPVPATFLVMPDRRIGYEFVEVDFRNRCCPDQVIDEIRASQRAG